ncbi:MAG: hypothetical protein ACI4AA_04260 [Lachnospiraceae bacterium]
MLKKLIKHEWKDTWAVGTVCNIIVFVLAIIGVVLFSMDIWEESAMRSDSAAGFTAVTLVVYFMMCVWGIIAACFVVRYYFFWRYYKNLFTDHGYLMNTLPVKSTDLINSKLIVAVIWQYITYIVMAFSIVALVFSIVGGLSDISFKEMMQEFYGFEFDWEEIGKSLPTIICEIAYIIIAPAVQLLLMYAAVCVGQLSKKHKFLVSVLILIGFGILTTVVISYATVPFVLMMDDEVPSVMVQNIESVVILLIYIGAGVGLYFLNKYFLEKKLNLE